MSNKNIQECTKEDLEKAENTIVTWSKNKQSEKVESLIKIIRYLCWKYSVEEMNNINLYHDLYEKIFEWTDHNLKWIANHAILLLYPLKKISQFTKEELVPWLEEKQLFWKKWEFILKDIEELFSFTECNSSWKNKVSFLKIWFWNKDFISLLSKKNIENIEMFKFQLLSCPYFMMNAIYWTLNKDIEDSIQEIIDILDKEWFDQKDIILLFKTLKNSIKLTLSQQSIMNANLLHHIHSLYFRINRLFEVFELKLENMYSN